MANLWCFLELCTYVTCVPVLVSFGHVLTFLPNGPMYLTTIAKFDFGYYSFYGSGVNKNDKIR